MCRRLTLTRKGRGFALRSAWSASEGRGRGLHGRRPLHLPVGPPAAHRVGALGPQRRRRRHPPALGLSARGPKRELISRAYSHIVRLSLHSRISDFQCGFKAIRRDRALEILPMVEDNGWFFDTELLVTAERLGARVAETPVEWTDDPDSSVDIVATAAEDLRGIWRLARAPHPPARVRTTRTVRRPPARWAPTSCCRSPAWACSAH